MANAKLKYILELENNAKLKPIIAEVQQAAQGFDGLKAKIETSARSLGLMQRELSAMQAKFDANAQRISQLQTKLASMSDATDKESQEATKLRAELDRLTATNDKLSISMERKSISIQRSTDNLKLLGQQANATADQLDRAGDTIGQMSQKSGTGTSAMIGHIKDLAGAYLGLETVTQAANFAFEGFKLGAGIEQARLSVQTLTKDIDKGNQIFDTAIQFGQKYGYTQEEMATSVNQAIGIINRSNQSTEKSLEVLARLASVNPEQGFEGAVVAMKELETGELTSIADRFNLGKDTARAMFNEIKAGKDPIVALDEALNGMGVTNEVLENRMKGSNGALLDMKLAAENAKLAAGDFLNAIGTPELLTAFADGLNSLAGGFSAVRDAAGATEQMTLGQSFADYNAQLDQANAKNAQATNGFWQVTQRLGGVGAGLNVLHGAYQFFNQQSDQLTDHQYKLAQALMQSGASSEQAADGARTLGPALSDAWGQMSNLVVNGEMTKETMQGINSQMLQLGTSSPMTATAIAELTAQLVDGDITMQQFRDDLDNLTASQELNQAATEAQAAMQAAQAEQTQAQTDMLNIFNSALEYATLLTEGGTLALGDMNQAQYDNILAFGEQALAAELHEQRMQLLNDTVYAVADGSMTLDGAISYLSQQFNISRAEAEKLINTFLRLTSVMRMGKGGDAAGAMLEGAGNAVSDLIEQTRNAGANAGKGLDRAVGSGVRRAARPDIYGPKDKKKKGGNKGGKSEEVKAAEKEQKDLAKAEKSIETARQNHNKKLEDIDKKHAAELIKINAEYIAKALAAEQKFNTDKFALRNGFKQQLFDIDRDLYDAARAEEVKYWDESQAIAQAGDATKAAELYAAGQELAQMRADHAQQLRDIDAEIANAETEAEAARLADRKQRMEEAYAEEQRLAEENIGKIRSGEDTLKQERDQAIADEQRDYAKARTEAEQQFADSLQKIIDGYDAVDEATTRTKDAIVDMVNTLVPEFARLAGAASAVPSGAPASVEAAAGRAFGGNVRAGQPYTVGEFGREMFIPRQSGTILNQRQLDRAMNRGDMPRNGRQETINRDEMIINVTGTAKEITQAEAAIERIAERVYDRRMKLTVNRVVTKRPR